MSLLVEVFNQLVSLLLENIWPYPQINKIVLYGQAWKELWQELLDQWRYEIVNPHAFRRIEE